MIIKFKKHFICLIYFLNFINSSYSLAQNKNLSQFDSLYNKAKLYFDKNNSAKCLEYLQKANSCKPDDFDVYKLFIRTYAGLDDWPKVYYWACKMYKDYPEEPYAMLVYSEANNVLGHTNIALKVANKLIKVDPDNFSAFLTIAHAYSSLDKPEKAIEALNRAQNLNSDTVYGSFALYYLYGQELNEINRYSEALKYFNKCLEINPKDQDVMRNIVQTMLYRGSLQEAKNYLDAISKLYPHNGDFYELYCKLYLELSKFDEALKYIDMAISLDKKNVSYISQKGRVYFYMQNRQKALFYYLQAEQMDPKDYNNLLRIADCYSHFYQFKNAVKYYQKAILLKPHEKNIYLKKACNELCLLDFIGAFQDYLKSIL